MPFVVASDSCSILSLSLVSIQTLSVGIQYSRFYIVLVFRPFVLVSLHTVESCYLLSIRESCIWLQLHGSCFIVLESERTIKASDRETLRPNRCALPFISLCLSCADGGMDPHQAIGVLGRAHVVLHGRDVEKATKLAEVLKAFLRHRAEAFVRSNSASVVLEIFMSDGTPITTAVRHNAVLQGESIRRAGRSSREYLVQLALIVGFDWRFSCFFLIQS